MSNLSDEDKLTLARIKVRIEKDREKAEQFWREEYPGLKLEERKKFWLRRILKNIRIQGESEADEFSIFTESSYKEWKEIDSEIDDILDYAINSVDDLYAENGRLIRELNEKLGRI